MENFLPEKVQALYTGCFGKGVYCGILWAIRKHGRESRSLGNSDVVQSWFFSTRPGWGSLPLPQQPALIPTSGRLLTPGFFCPPAPILYLLSGALLEIYSAINCCSSVPSLDPLRKRVHQATSEAPGCPRVMCPPWSSLLGGVT